MKQINHFDKYLLSKLNAEKKESPVIEIHEESVGSQAITVAVEWSHKSNQKGFLKESSHESLET